MTTTFNPGDRAYTFDGDECEFVATAGDGFVVRKVYTVDEGNGNEREELSAPEVLREVFATPPVARRHQEVTKLEEMLRDLRNKIAAAHREAAELAAAAKQRDAVLAEHRAVARVVDFIQGKITHFVVFEWNGCKVVDTATAVNCMEHGRWTGETKLLTLFGHHADGGWGPAKSYGLEWRLDRWPDGSGGSTTRVIPCMSLEEAMGEARRHFDALFTEESSEDKRRFWPDGAKNATALGIEVPAHVVEHNKARAIATARESLAGYEAKASEIRAQLAALTGEG